MPNPPHRCAARAACAALLLLSALGGSASRAQQEPAPAEAGRIVGRVVDADSGAPAEGVEVTVTGPAAPGGAPFEERRLTDAQGEFELPALAAGRYQLRFSKEGYRDSTLSDLEVAAGQASRADMSLPPESERAAVPPEPTDVEEFVIIASPVAEILSASRLDSDELINTLGAAEFDKLAIGDVAEGLKFVSGVNVVEGQFAVIRGLEDRYSSTLYNFGPVPSPDPNRQSVQLDLFPSDIVTDLVIAKTFGADLPSNSSGGSINILTHDYPEEFEFKLSGGSGWNANAADRFLEFKENSMIGQETDSSDVIESDFAGSFGGRTELAEREVRFKAIVANEIDYETKDGVQESREPHRCLGTNNLACVPGGPVGRAGGLSLGDLFLTAGKYDLTESERVGQFTGYGGLGVDLDEAGDHKLDASAFYTDSESEIVQLKENGFLPNFDYTILADLQNNGEETLSQVYNEFATFTSALRSFRPTPDAGSERGPLWYTNRYESKSFDIDRELLLYQINGDHVIEALDGLHVRWAANQAHTTQDETALAARYFFEPDDVFQAPPTELPVQEGSLGPGGYAANSPILRSDNDIEENQDFGRLDFEYEVDATEELAFTLSTGGWYERAKRDVASSFLETSNVGGAAQYAVLGDTPEELGKNIHEQVSGSVRDSSNDSTREIQAWHMGLKTTLFDDFDVLSGFRLEDIFIESLNDPFTGVNDFSGSPAIFPSKWLFFDRLDNPGRGECIPAPPPNQAQCAFPGSNFNDEILGISVPVDPATGLVDLVDADDINSLVNGEIDEFYFLPSLGFTYRAYEGVALRGAWSQTVARPSFRELGYYVSVEPGSDDLIVGNPQLDLSEVESYDLRLEYLGDLGDLAAISLFYKLIDDPIEVIVLRDPSNAELAGNALFRTFLNNPDQAELQGMELEARKNLEFLGPELAQYFSIGGNFTYIDAEVDRTPAELGRATPFFGVPPGQNQKYAKLDTSRRLYGQPEWIANTDISFDHPDWGTKATLALFAISDVLDAAGSAFIQPNGQPRDYTLDRYIDSFYQVDLILSQRIWRGLTAKVSIKNLTDSKRRIIYDSGQTDSEFTERAYRVGQDYSFSLSYTLSF